MLFLILRKDVEKLSRWSKNPSRMYVSFFGVHILHSRQLRCENFHNIHIQMRAPLLTDTPSVVCVDDLAFHILAVCGSHPPSVRPIVVHGRDRLPRDPSQGAVGDLAAACKELFDGFSFCCCCCCSHFFSFQFAAFFNLLRRSSSRNLVIIFARKGIPSVHLKYSRTNLRSSTTSFATRFSRFARFNSRPNSSSGLYIHPTFFILFLPFQ